MSAGHFCNAVQLGGDKMKRYLLFALLIGLVVLGVACGAAAVPSARSQVIPGAIEPAQPPVAAYDDATGGVANQAPRKSVPASAPQESGEADQAAQDEQRMIVYTGGISLQVNDTADT